MKKDRNTKHLLGNYIIELGKTKLSSVLNTEIVPIVKTFGIGYDRWAHIAFSKTKDGKFYIFKNGFNIASTIALEKKIEKILDIQTTSKEWSVYFFIRFTNITGLGYWIDDFTIRIRPFNPKYDIGDKTIEWIDSKWDNNFDKPTIGD